MVKINVAWPDNLQLHQGHRKSRPNLPSFSSLLPRIHLPLSSHFLHTNAGSDSYVIKKSWHRSAETRWKYNSRQKRGKSFTPTILELHSVASILWCVKHKPLLKLYKHFKAENSSQTWTEYNKRINVTPEFLPQTHMTVPYRERHSVAFAPFSEAQVSYCFNGTAPTRC